VGLDRLQGRREPEVDPTPAELLGGVVAEAAGHLGENLRAGVDEHPALRHVAEPGIVAQRVVDELGELGERLDTRVAGADEHERQMALGVRRVGVRVIELAQDVVPEVDGVGDVLEREAVLGETGNREHARHRAERDDEPLVPELEAPELALDGDRARALVERGGAAADDVGMRTHDPERHDDVARLDRACRHLGQQRRVEHRALGADDGRPLLAEQARDVRAAEATPEDEGPTTCRPRHAATSSALNLFMASSAATLYASANVG
jgi:hypothetical protein